jgi:phospholipase C
VISPFAKPNFVSHTALDQTSVLSFIEYNWLTGTIGSGSFDAGAGSLLDLFDFSSAPQPQLTLDPATGEPATP